MRRSGVRPSVRLSIYVPALESNSGQRLTVRSEGRGSPQTCINELQLSVFIYMYVGISLIAPQQAQRHYA